MTQNAALVSIVVFAFNEGENVVPVLKELTEWLNQQSWTSEILFVNDGSTDDTQERAERVLAGFPGQVLQHTKNKGIGAAIKTGTRAAVGEYVTFLPCDGQIPPTAVGTLLSATTAANVDVVLSMYIARNDGFRRKVLSWGVRQLISVVHGVDLKSEGPYLFRRPLLLPQQLDANSFFLNFEFPIRALAAGLEVRTVDLPCRPRRAGRSKAAAARQIRAVANDLVQLRWKRTRSTLERAIGKRLE